MQQRRMLLQDDTTTTPASDWFPKLPSYAIFVMRLNRKVVELPCLHKTPPAGARLFALFSTSVMLHTYFGSAAGNMEDRIFQKI